MTETEEAPTVECPDCKAGLTPSRAALQRIVHLLLISACDGATGDRHPWLVGANVPHSDETLAELTKGLCGRGLLGRAGHDSIDCFVATKKIIVAAGLDPDIWGLCQTCKGHAYLYTCFHCQRAGAVFVGNHEGKELYGCPPRSGCRTKDDEFPPGAVG